MIGEGAFFQRLVRATGIENEATPLPESSVTAALADEYALSGELTPISTEKDDTFRLESPAGRLLVKVAPAGEERQVVDLQSAAMRHVDSRAPDIPVQRLIRGVDDQTDAVVTDAAGRERVMRVFSYIDGPLLHQVTATPSQLRRTGAILARMDAALADFRHPCESRLLLWDLKHFSALRHLVTHVADPADRHLAHTVFDSFESHVVPALPALETQAIHGDYSPFNIVVDATSREFVKGVIDFGDVVRGPVLFEASVAAANQLGLDPRDPWASSVEIIRGYCEVRPLPPEVLELITYTAPARLLLRALVYGWRSMRDPLSRAYAQSHSAMDWRRLRMALAVGETAVRAKLADANPATDLARKD